MKTAASVDLLGGERVGIAGSRLDRSSYVIAMFANELNAGRVLKIVQFDLQTPTDSKVDGKRERKESKSDSKSHAQTTSVTHTFLRIEWFRPMPVERKSSSLAKLQRKLAPRFYLDNPYDNVMFQWIPIQRVVCRFAPRFTTTARADRRIFVACLLPRKVNLEV